MKEIILRPVEPERDFETLAALFTKEQDEPTTRDSLTEDYEQHKERIFCLMGAEDEQGEFLGFNWAVRSRFDSSRAYFYLIVKPEHRMQGVGSRLFENALQAAQEADVKELEVSIRDDCEACRKFAENRGFKGKKHLMAMALDLAIFDDVPYDRIIENLRNEGFNFTSMAALGNTGDAQRKLFALNNATAKDVPGTDSESSWLSFEDFQKSVCMANWYKPDGQMVVVDTSTNEFVALSAITRFEGADYAYNLHTGVDRQYRGRKLAQAVKVLALRYARDVLKVKVVRTHHNDKNLPMIAIDRKLGYVQIPGVVIFVKKL